jgi:hypothetical protein
MELWSGYPHPHRRPWPSPTAKDANECARRNAQVHTPHTRHQEQAGRAWGSRDCWIASRAAVARGVAMNENDGAPPDDDTKERAKRERREAEEKWPDGVQALAQGPAGQHIGGRGNRQGDRTRPERRVPPGARAGQFFREHPLHPSRLAASLPVRGGQRPGCASRHRGKSLRTARLGSQRGGFCSLTSLVMIGRDAWAACLVSCDADWGCRSC